MDQSRRQLLKTVLLGAGGFGLRSLVSSLPAALLAAPELATGQAFEPCSATTTANGAGGLMPQKIVLITSAAGDPLNANVPGTYEPHAPLVYHPSETDPNYLPTGTFTTDRGAYKCAAAWASLPAAMLDHTCFFHHATYTPAHGDHAKVNAYMGAIRRQELLVSLLAKHMAGCLNTTQVQPIVLSEVLIRYAGAVLPVLSRSGLRDVLANPTGNDLARRGLRDRDLSALVERVFRPTATPAQQAALDRYQASQAAARAADPALAASLVSQADNSELLRLNTATVALLRMNVSPVVVMSYPFGGDNHSDGGLYNEANQTKSGVAALQDLWTKLSSAGLQNDVTVVLQNVFGRTLNAAARNGNRNGRDHNGAHHCTVLVGAGLRRSVIGGLTAMGNDFRAQAIDSQSGAATPAGDVIYEDTLASLGKTIGAAVGVRRAILDDQITKGTYVTAALSAPVT
jgi:hypothetical protein